MVHLKKEDSSAASRWCFVDVKNAFLQAEMKEEIMYITQPEGYVDSDHPNWLCLLLKSLYRIKQAPRVWKETLHKFLIKPNFNQSNTDPCVYTRLNKIVKTLMTVYVDDLTLIGMPQDISEIKDYDLEVNLINMSKWAGINNHEKVCIQHH